MARKRKVNWGPVLWLATALNVAVGLTFSPVTSAAKVRVVGALPTDRERVREAVQGFRGKPALRSGSEKVLEQLYRRPDLRSAEWSQNLFRRGRLVLKYDPYVARFASPSNAVLTSRGQIAQTAEPIHNLPRLDLFEGARDPAAALSAPFEAVKVADVCYRAASLKLENLSVSVQANGGVCLNLGTTGRVSLGSPDDLDAKFEKLEQILAQEPGILGQRKEIVLLAPSRAVVRPLGTL